VTNSPLPAGAAVRGAEELVRKAAAVKVAARRLGRASTDEKNRALRQIASVLRARESEILAANERDCKGAVRAAERSGEAALLDRLTLNSARLQAMARDVESVAELPDPIG
jgi:glutamate-5-semialdehyde dehydrogenase